MSEVNRFIPMIGIVVCNSSIAMMPYRYYSIVQAIAIRKQTGWTIPVSNPTPFSLRYWIIPEKDILKRTYDPKYLAFVKPYSRDEYFIRNADTNKNPYLVRVLYFSGNTATEPFTKEDYKIHNLSSTARLRLGTCQDEIRVCNHIH